MSEQSLKQLTEVLAWAENEAGAGWADPEGPGPGLLQRLDARRKLALLADDLGDYESSNTLRAAPLEASVPWHTLPDEAQVAAALLVARRARNAAANARDLAGEERSPDDQPLAEMLQNERDRSIGFLEALVENAASLGEPGRGKLAGQLGYAYGSLAWGYEHIDTERCVEIFDVLVALHRAHPENAIIADGLTFALTALLPKDESAPEETATLRERIAIFIGIFDALPGHEQSNWRVNSAACLAVLSAHLPGEEAFSAAMKASDRLLEWTDPAWDEQNTGYAIYQVLEALFRLMRADRPVIGERLTDVLQAYRAKAPEKVRTSMADYLFRLFNTREVPGPLLEPLSAELCDLLATLKEPEQIRTTVPNLVLKAGAMGTAQLGRFWDVVHSASPLVRQFWIAGLAFSPPEHLDRDVAEEHLRRLRKIRPEVAGPGTQDWITALNTVSVALVARDASGTVREAVTSFSDDPSCPMEFWLEPAGLAMIGAGRDAPEWLADMLARIEPVVSKEPVDASLRAGLSYLISSALHECAAASRTDDLPRLTLVLDRLTAPGAKPEEEQD